MVRVMGDSTPDLRALDHHGDADAAPGLLDFAVNVWGGAPPPWLRARLARLIDDLAQYPAAGHDARARAAVAARHGRRPDEVLVLAGSAEGFALLPALAPQHAAVVHPGFTEPEVALRRAGVPVTRVLTDPAAGHRLDPGAVEAAAAARTLAVQRRAQATELAAVPGVQVLPGVAPYLLLRLPVGTGDWVRAELRSAGIAVRRCDTFPGLDADHLRVAVRPSILVNRLVDALAVPLTEVGDAESGDTPGS
ncbi:aminotransferase class I/II-fold pyridoxal phosphate-dependent enzyme, partial [Pseudonocardia sulfidoxydans]